MMMKLTIIAVGVCCASALSDGTTGLESFTPGGVAGAPGIATKYQLDDAVRQINHLLLLVAHLDPTTTSSRPLAPPAWMAYMLPLTLQPMMLALTRRA